MQARISKSNLDTFKIASSQIKVNDILPILKYIKFEVKGDTCFITKNNHKAFVIHSFENDSEDCAFLVDENILNNFLSYSDGDFLDFKLEGNRIKISDTRSFVESPTERAIEFPTIDLTNNDWKPIPKLATTTAGVCANLIFNGEVMDAKSFVFIGMGQVAGTDGAIGYSQPVAGDLPEIILRKDVATSVSKMASCEWSSNASYDFFKEPGMLYGFSKIEAGFFNLGPMFGAIPDDLAFNIPKQLLIKFCNLCTSSITNKTSIVHSSIRTQDGKFIMKMEGSDITIESNLPITGTTRPFKFEPDKMRTLLDALPCDNVYFYPGNHRYYITDIDRGFISVIMEII